MSHDKRHAQALHDSRLFLPMSHLASDLGWGHRPERGHYRISSPQNAVRLEPQVSAVDLRMME